MSDRPPCPVCGRRVEESPDSAAEPASAAGLCRRCLGAVRALSGDGPRSPPDARVLEYEPVGREYAPEDGELVFLATEPGFYRVELESGGDEPMIYLRPVPASESAERVPITDLAAEIGAAMDADEFYRATVDADGILEHELWWRTVAANAPSEADPSSGGREERGEDGEDGSEDDGGRNGEDGGRGPGDEDGDRGPEDEFDGDISLPETDEGAEDRPAEGSESDEGADRFEPLDLG